MVFEIFQFGVRHLAGRMLADCLEHVLNGHVVPLELARHDRPAVEHERRDVQACERHDGAGDGLVATGQSDDPSNRWPRATSSMESAMTSRLISEAFMPSVPIEMPSETAMVLYSIGVPPAARMPAFTRSDNRRRWKLQGMTSIQVLATPINGRWTGRHR